MTDARPVSATPVVTEDDQALLADIFAKMEEVLKPLPGELSKGDEA